MVSTVSNSSSDRRDAQNHPDREDSSTEQATLAMQVCLVYTFTTLGISIEEITYLLPSEHKTIKKFRGLIPIYKTLHTENRQLVRVQRSHPNI